MTVPPAPSGDIVKGEHTSFASPLQDIPLVYSQRLQPLALGMVGTYSPFYVFMDILSMNLCNHFFKSTDIVYLDNLMKQQDPKVLVQRDLINNSLIFSIWKNLWCLQKWRSRWLHTKTSPFCLTFFTFVVLLQISLMISAECKKCLQDLFPEM